jgi:replicative DNA helicase
VTTRRNSRGNPAELFDRAKPHDPTAERAVVFSLLLDPPRIGEVAELLRPGDFHNEQLAVVFGAMMHAHRDGALPDLPAVKARLEAVGGWNNDVAAEIAAARESQPTAANVAHHARRVADLAARRRILHAAEETIRQVYLGGDPAGLRSRLAAELEQLDGGRRAVDFSPMTLAELMRADVAVEYLIDGLLVARQPMLVAGPVKSLKTSVLLDLALALATGGAFLGYFRVLRSVPVAVLTGESGLPTVKDTLQRIAAAAGVDPSTVTRLVVSDRIPQLNDPAHLDAIKRLVLDREIEVLAVDPAYLALDGADANNVMVFGQQLRAVSDLCQSHGLALILCHHTKKGSGGDHEPLSLTDAAWAGFAEHARQWLLVNHRERYDHAAGVHRLWLAAGGSAGHGGLWAVDVAQGRQADPGGRQWSVTVLPADEARKTEAERRDEAKRKRKADQAAKDLEADRREIVQALTRSKRPETKSGLRERVGSGYQRFKAAFASLVDDGTIELTELKRRNGQSYEAWQLRGDA